MLFRSQRGQKVLPIGPGDTLREAASRLIWTGAETLPVIDGGMVVGLVRAGDIWRAGGQKAPVEASGSQS